MADKRNSTNHKVHPDLGDFDVSVSTFGEIEGSTSIDDINKFLDKNVKDKKLSRKQMGSDTK
jgi:hypothetical protein